MSGNGKKLTKEAKKEIFESFEKGVDITIITKKFNITPKTARTHQLRFTTCQYVKHDNSPNSLNTFMNNYRQLEGDEEGTKAKEIYDYYIYKIMRSKGFNTKGILSQATFLTCLMRKYFNTFKDRVPGNLLFPVILKKGDEL